VGKQPKAGVKVKKVGTSKSDDYSANSLRVLRFPLNIRTRPGMYVGGVTADTGLFRIFKEALDNSIDEAMNGHGSNILVEYNSKTKVFIVADRGRGIPTGMNKKEGKSSLELALTSMHGSGKFDQANYISSAGMNGIGMKALVALSTYCKAWSANEGMWKHLHLKRGIVHGGVTKDTPKHPWGKKKQGTIIEWVPDPQIFKEEAIRPERMLLEAEHLAMLNPGLELVVVIDGTKSVFKSENGLLDMIYGTPDQKQLTLGKPFHYQKKGLIDIAISWQDDEVPTTFAFVNSSHTPEEGTHVNGARNAIVEALRAEVDNGPKKAAPAKKGARGKKAEKDTPIDGKFLLMGMQLALNWRMTDPVYSGQTKDKLTNSEVTTKVKNIVLPEFSAFLKQNPKIISILIDRAKKFQKAQDKFQQELNAVKTIKLASPNARGLLPGKLAQHRGKCKPEEVELFLVEGESAAGPAKEVRLPFQEVLELRGKVLNAERATFASLLNSPSVMTIVTSTGAKPGDECKTHGGSVRIGRINIMTDADPDGDHIDALLCAFFAKYYRPWIDEGRIALVFLPLFVGAHGEQKEFGFSRDEMLSKFPESKRKHVIVNRLKGLGEMTNTELFTHGMDPKTRRVRVLTMSDLDAHDVKRIMGNEEEHKIHRKEILGITAKGAR
jgi:DNA gyrase subunit B